MTLLDRIVIFGAAGDLARRYLLPALARLLSAGRLPDGFEVVAAARGAEGTDAYRDRAQGWLQEHAPDVPADARRALLQRLRSCAADATDAADVRAAVEPARGPAAVYLALPPAAFAPAVEALAAVGLPPGSRLAVEKPFGTSLANARALNRLLHRCLPEDAVFRIDHFLGLQTVQNIVGLRFGNRVLEPVWNAQHVARVEIVWDETLTLEGRGYYDRVGALRDLVQNHLLQLLALLAMEPPARFDARELGDRKSDLLRAVRRLGPEGVATSTVRGRYTAGQIGGRRVPDYAEEQSVDAARGTETFAQVTLEVDNWRWSGVQFTLRTGKALGAGRREVVVTFRPVPLPDLAGSAEANALRIPLDPETLTLQLNLNAPGEPFALRPVELSEQLAAPDLPAYARVLLAVLEGDASLSIGGDEAEESWAIVEPVLAGWQRDLVPLLPYPAGSAGPTATDRLEQGGRR